jgi:exportin-T
MAFVFFGRCVSVWGKPADAAPLSGEIGQGSESGVPGFETFIYKSLVPTSFELLALPGFNIKDGQHLVVAHEVANFLQTVCRTRGAPEASQFLAGVFLPAQGWPQHTAAEFVEKLGTLEPKAFRKYFTDMVRASRA